jgi:hypothetical protein
VQRLCAWAGRATSRAWVAGRLTCADTDGVLAPHNPRYTKMKPSAPASVRTCCLSVGQSRSRGQPLQIRMKVCHPTGWQSTVLASRWSGGCQLGNLVCRQRDLLCISPSRRSSHPSHRSGAQGAPAALPAGQYGALPSSGSRRLNSLPKRATPPGCGYAGCEGRRQRVRTTRPLPSLASARMRDGGDQSPAHRRSPRSPRPSAARR